MDGGEGGDMERIWVVVNTATLKLLAAQIVAQLKRCSQGNGVNRKIW